MYLNYRGTAARANAARQSVPRVVIRVHVLQPAPAAL